VVTVHQQHYSYETTPASTTGGARFAYSRECSNLHGSPERWLRTTNVNGSIDQVQQLMNTPSADFLPCAK
jgi:hypothetical protein